MNLQPARASHLRLTKADRQQNLPHHKQFNLYLWIAIGGVLGTYARYELSLIITAGKGAIPWATFIVNVVGSFILGALLELLVRSGKDMGLRRRIRLLVGTGFCGSLTTFSTFATETDLLVKGGHLGVADIYLVLTTTFGLLAAVVGIRVATMQLRRAGGKN